MKYVDLNIWSNDIQSNPPQKQQPYHALDQMQRNAQLKKQSMHHNMTVQPQVIKPRASPPPQVDPKQTDKLYSLLNQMAYELDNQKAANAKLKKQIDKTIKKRGSKDFYNKIAILAVFFILFLILMYLKYVYNVCNLLLNK